MARVKVTGKSKVKRGLTKQIESGAVKALYKDRNKLLSAIKDEIKSGKSPVVNQKWAQYSEDYANREKGGSRKPVNMTQSGDMLKSLTMDKKAGGIDIFFGSFIAAFHDTLGAGRSKVIRRLLPDAGKGERFNTKLTKLINDIIRSAFRG